MGFVGDEARAALLRGASVLAFPSVYEGFGLPPLEAMSAGTPVVCTDAGSLPEIVGDAAEVVGVAGLDGATLAAALARVLNDEARREELVTTGRQNVERFSWERCVEALAALYRRAADADGTC
jgi:alpha-1,3-rhamnosyl/mannosyltransferase